MTFIVANPLTDFEINHEFEKAYFEKTCSSKIPDVSFSVEKTNMNITAIEKSMPSIALKTTFAGKAG